MTTLNELCTGLLSLDGAMAAAVVDANSGMLLAQAGGGVDLDVAAAGNTEVVRAKMKTMKALGLKDAIEDILITLGKHYHIIRPVVTKPGLFIYLVLDKTKSNLAMARRSVLDAEGALA